MGILECFCYGLPVRFLTRQWFKFLLAALLAVTPVLPAFAFGHHGLPTAAHAVPASDAHADSAHHAPSKSSACDKHDGCQGQCCAAVCAQTFTVASGLPAPAADARPVQTPTVRELYDSLLVTFLNRPPQAG